MNIPTNSASKGVSEASMSQYLSKLFRLLSGSDISESKLHESVKFLKLQQEVATMNNETRCAEKLKIHLIHQNKHKEAKQFTELHQKLKGMHVIKNREAVVILLYELFDKESTRRALEAKKNAQEGCRTGSEPKLSYQLSKRDKVSTVCSINVDRRRERSCPTQETGRGHFSGVTSSRNLLQEQSANGSEREFDPTAMPNLYFAADASLKSEIHIKQNKIPPLQSNGNDKGIGYALAGVGLGSLGRNASSNLSKTINFPKDYSRNLLSEDREKPAGKEVLTNFRIRSPLVGNHQNQNRGSPSQNGFSHSQFQGVDMEKELIKNLVFIFQGIEGNIIKNNSKGMYEVFTRKSLHPSLRLQTLRLCELGYFYKKIRKYSEKPTVGLMPQGLKHALETELQEYYRLLAIVQAECQQTTIETPMSDEISRSGEEMTILKLTVWMMDCRPRLEVLAGIIDACEELKGGEMCSMLYKYSLHGDPMVCTVTNSLLSTVSKPLYIMVCQWILYGELEDPYNEFFIAADISCKKEHLWQAKYHLRLAMLPSFITLKQAQRVLAIGKSINFLKEICNNAKGYENRHQIKCWLEKSPIECIFMEEDKLLNSAIEKAYKTTSEMVLKVLIEESRLIDHLKAIKNYLLLGQGDFIQHLLELIQHELSKPASKLFHHNTSAILESAIRATNAQFENENILSRLDTRILPSSDKDLGWDVFCLDYKVHGPIGTVLTEDIMIRYNQLFNTLWRTKRIEMILSTLWKNQTTLFKYQRMIPELGPVLHRSELLISEMIHFVHQTQYYIMFEATECAWDRLMEEVSKATDLDEVISAHNKFLQSITNRSLLNPESRELLNQLRGIFDSVHELKSFLVDFDNKATNELKTRKALKNNSEQHEAQKTFFTSYVIQAKGKIETLYTTTQDLVRSFLLVLNRQPDLTLQCLSFRLDFNEYYHFKDSRLSQPLTFQHRRLSSNIFDPLGTSTNGLNQPQPLFASRSILEMYED